MKIELKGKPVDVKVYTNQKLEALLDENITLADLSKGVTYHGEATIDGKEYFLKFADMAAGGIWSYEVSRLKAFEKSLYTPKFYCTEKVGHEREVLITEKCSGQPLQARAAISIDDGIFILDQLANLLKQFYSEKLIVNGEYFAEISNPANLLWDKEKRRLYFVDFGPTNGRILFKDLIKHALRMLERNCGAIDSTLFENFIDTYFGLLYDSPPKDINWAADFKKRCKEYNSGQPYQTGFVLKLNVDVQKWR